MSTQVIYARVPEAVKSDAEEYAEQRGLSLSSSVVDLLQRGLAAAGEERSVANLEAKVARLTREKGALEAKLAVAENEMSAMRSFAQRANTTKVGTCPACDSDISGLDLLATGRCGQCQHSLLDLLAPPPPSKQKPMLDERAVGVLVGALGVALITAAVLGKGA
jgi:antitoxin component of RelBE/YafQ-DinJ toxin-antitoxin module